MTLDPDELAKIKERAEKASPGPWEGPVCDWEYNEDDPCAKRVWSWKIGGEIAWETDSGCPGYGLKKDDANFCANARQDIPSLLAHIEELEKLVRAMNEDC